MKTKVNYLPKNRSRYPYFKKTLVLVAIFLLGVALSYFFRGELISLFYPLWKARNNFIQSEEPTTASSIENQKNTLLELAGRKTDPKTTIAAVLTYPYQTFYDTIIIDAGSDDLVAVGSEVSLPEGPVLGTVSEVFSKTAKVKLFSSSGEKTTAVLERDNVPVVLIGVGGGNFKITLPRDMAVENGDRILSADTASRLLAVVGDVSSSPTDSFKEVLAKSPTNIFTLRFVFVTP